MTESNKEYLLVSRGLYWAPNNSGYVGVKELAGRYKKSCADEECGIIAVHENDAPDYSAKCWPDVKERHILSKVQAQLDTANKRIAELEGHLSRMICDDCPPVDYPNDKTRCTPCPRRKP